MIGAPVIGLGRTADPHNTSSLPPGRQTWEPVGFLYWHLGETSALSARLARLESMFKGSIGLAQARKAGLLLRRADCSRTCPASLPRSTR